MLPALLLSVACGPGPVDLSTVTDTRVIAIQGSPPEPWPGETTRITATVANPEQRALEVLLWTCIPWEDRCLEDEGLSALSDQASIVRADEGLATTTRRVPDIPSVLPDAVLQELLAQDDDIGGIGDIKSIPVQVFALACPLNDCDLINRVRDALRRGRGPGGSIGQDLFDPTRWMVELPVGGVSLATKTLKVARPDREDRNDNPIVEARWMAASGDLLEMEEDVPYELAFAVDDPDRDKVYAYGYTTLGRFYDRSEKVDDGIVRLYLLPEQTGRGELWVVFEDDEGGTAIWSRPFRVR